MLLAVLVRWRVAYGARLVACDVWRVSMCMGCVRCAALEVGTLLYCTEFVYVRRG